MTSIPRSRYRYIFEPSAFGADIDYALLQKLYGADPAGEKRYSPAQRIGCRVETVTGDPNPKHISTWYVERKNLT